MDGLACDAGRQSVTVGADVARARRARCAMCGARPARGERRCASCGAFLVPVSRRQRSRGEEAAAPGTAVAGEGSAGGGANAAPPAVSHSYPAMDLSLPAHDLPIASRRGERLVALSALGVLAIASVFFVERLGMLSDLRQPPPVIEATSTPANVDVGLRIAENAPSGGEPSLPASASEKATTQDEAQASPRARSRPTVATVRKPDVLAEARARLAGSVRSSAALSVANAPPAPPYVRTRWDLLRQEVSWCTQQPSFFDAVLCEQRARQRWCEEWWGRTPECPSGRQGDYAN